MKNVLLAAFPLLFMACSNDETTENDASDELSPTDSSATSVDTVNRSNEDMNDFSDTIFFDFKDLEMKSTNQTNIKGTEYTVQCEVNYTSEFKEDPASVESSFIYEWINPKLEVITKDNNGDVLNTSMIDRSVFEDYVLEGAYNTYVFDQEFFKNTRLAEYDFSIYGNQLKTNFFYLWNEYLWEGAAIEVILNLETFETTIEKEISCGSCDY